MSNANNPQSDVFPHPESMKEMSLTLTDSSPRTRWAVLVAAFLGWMFDGLEMGLFPLIARPALQQMQPENAVMITDAYVGHWMAIATAAFLIGAAGGGLLFGWLGDRIGRVKAMSMAILCYSLFTGLIFFVRTPEQLTIMRFVAALGMGGEWALGVALVMEVWPERHRPILAGVIGAANNVGFLLIATIGMAFSVTQASWRWIALVGAVPALLTFIIRLFVPESEKWQRASVVPVRPLREIAGTTKYRNLTLLASCLGGVALMGSWGSVQWLPLWADQMTDGLLPKAKAYSQALTAVGAVTGCLLGAWLGGKLNRRSAYALFCLASLVVCAALFRGIHEYGTAFLAMTFLTGLVTSTFYGWLPLYLPELFPTRIRATAQGIAFNLGRVLAAVGVLQTGALMQAFSGSYARAGAIISLIYGIGLLVIWKLPETSGRTLPE